MNEVFLTAAVSTLSIFISYVIGRIETFQNRKIEATRKMYESWHMSLIGLLYESSIWDVGFSGLPSEYREKFYHLVADNLQFMDLQTLEWVDIFLGGYQFVYGDTGKMPDGTKLMISLTPARLDETFDELICSALRHSQQPARILKQPKIGEHVLQLYLDSQKSRERLEKELSRLVDTSVR